MKKIAYCLLLPVTVRLCPAAYRMDFWCIQGWYFGKIRLSGKVRIV